MADKGDTYYCTWERLADGTCVGWEIRQPQLRAESLTPRELMQTLGDVIGEHYDDHEAALHFDPSLCAAGNPTWFADGFMELAWNSSFTYRPSASSAYANGRCGACGGGLGQRSDHPLVVDEIVTSADGAMSPASNEPPPTYGMPGSLMVVSAAFLNQLTDAERASFTPRRIETTNRFQHFYELVPRTIVAIGAIKGMDVDGWRCQECDRRTYSHAAGLGWGVKVVCRQELPKDHGNFFFVGDTTDVNVVCSVERWRSFAGTAYSRKLTGVRLAVVNAGEFDQQPLLGTLVEIAEFRRVHGFKIPFKPRPPD